MLTQLLNEYLPMIPPFVALVALYLLCNVLAWAWTRERGFIISGLTGGLFLVPFFMYHGKSGW